MSDSSNGTMHLLHKSAGMMLMLQRLNYGMSVEDLADYLRTTPEEIGKLERCERIIYPARLYWASQVFETSMESFFSPYDLLSQG